MEKNCLKTGFYQNKKQQDEIGKLEKLLSTEKNILKFNQVSFFKGFVPYQKTLSIKGSCGFLSIFAVAFHVFLDIAGSSNPAVHSLTLE